MLREVVTNEWFTILFVLSLILLAFAKFSFANRFSDFFMVIGSSRYLKIYVKEQKFIDLFDALLFTNLIISASIFGIIAYNTLVAPISFDIALLLKVLLSVGTIILIKVLVERLIGSLFEIDQLIDDYLFQKTNYKNYLGLILLPINILLVYTLEPTKILIYIVLLFLFIVNMIGFITTLKTYQNTILNNMFYFILYLCALEIGPYLILYKLLT